MGTAKLKMKELNSFMETAWSQWENAHRRSN